MQVLQWLTYAGVFVLIAIGIKSILSEHLRHGYILFVFALLMMLNLVILHRTGSGNTFLRIFIGIVAALFIYLVATGGESNTGPLWFYVFPPLIFYMLGLRQGLVVMTSCLLVIAVIFKFPELPFVITEYNPDFQLRFLTSMTFVTVFSYILDFSRRRARNDLIDLAERYDLASRTDELTRLSNRRDMRNRLDTEYYRFKRHGHHFSVVLMDIDHFKRINDGYGHDAGDEVLKDFAKLLKEHSRHLDVISRWGGEEFLILLPETSLVQALALAERLRFAVESAEFSYQSMLIPVTMSAGVCSISQFESIEGLLRQTDINLYEAKMKGRNRIVPMVKSTSRPEEHDSESV
ncbi:signal transduction diguanylate cyclase [Oleiphilus messinensis]|uniref:diguanylate cyclase n=1 Tax=Oleiphilus messinensis TaxID=141451 RepID=A0A1Y0IGT8_9GAMM|nr:signal transduction diguanylate cyclase [Oleiphilus messinensis]